VTTAGGSTGVAPAFGHVFVVDTKNVMVPVGLAAPAKVAVSWTEPPAVIVVLDRAVVRVGLAKPVPSGT
jgi:hypothetical protein